MSGRAAGLIGLGLVAFAGLTTATAQTPRRTPPPIRAHVRMCTLMDGNPYAVVVERGTCGMGESEVSGGGDGGAAAAGAGGGALSSHCASQYSIRLTICNSMKNASAKDSCIALAASNYQMCMQSMIQSGFPY